ncbi:MAG: serine hydrolase domain-containing protein [Gemmatimonadales bacterium]|nr:serine hydrolase domain-containing protein [Gemmatimonadales bacterium]
MRYVCFAPAFASSLLAAQATPAPRDSLDAPGLTAWLDRVVPEALTAGEIPGAVVVVVKDGQVLVARGYGVADAARGIRMDPARTGLRVGSISKLFTWTAVMQQVERGRLNLDRDITADLDFPIPPTFDRPITLRHLMTHTAGFEERAFRTYRQPRALREHLLGTPVPERIFPPGQVVAYSNYGSMIGGYLVERVSGERFVDYVSRHVLEPLGMHRSSFLRPVPPSLAGDLSASYEGSPPEALPLDALDHEEPSGDPSGHLVTTGTDIARFMLAHLQRGRLGDATILAPETADTMHAPAVFPLPGANPIALGFFRTDRNGRRVISHAGDIEGFHADLQLLPDEGVGYFLAVNGSGAPRGLFGAGHLFRTTLFRRFMDRYYPAPPAPDEPTAPTAREHARLVAGEYQMSRRGVGDFIELETLLNRAAMNLVVTANDDGTIVTPPLLDFAEGRSRTWREVGPFSWREVGGTARLDMRVENGRVIAWLPRDLFSFVLQPVSPLEAARPNLALLIAAALVLAVTVLAWPLLRLFGRSPNPDLRPARLAALVGFGYLLCWTAIFGAGVPAKEGAEVWIRVVQGVGLVALIATVAAVRCAWQLARGKRGWPTVLVAMLVAVAMLETTWLSFGFHLISRSLVY